MRKSILALAVASLAVLALAATVAAAGPSGVAVREQARSRDMLPAILDLTSEEVQALRQDGLSLAQIAEQQGVDPQELIDALTARWEARIQARVTAGALTPDEATQLRTRLETQARDLVFKTTLGGMQGAAVGAGPNGAGSGQADRDRDGTCDGSGAGGGSGWRGGGNGGNGGSGGNGGGRP